MKLTRRAVFGFVGASLLPGSRPRGVTLEAISAAHLPHALVIPARADDGSAYFECREYRAASPAHLDQLHRALAHGEFSHHGIRPLLWQRQESSIYLFPVESLGARGEAWTNTASDPAWIQLRESVQVTAVSIYRRLPGGHGSTIRGNS